MIASKLKNLNWGKRGKGRREGGWRRERGWGRERVGKAELKIAAGHRSTSNQSSNQIGAKCKDICQVLGHIDQLSCSGFPENLLSRFSEVW